MDTLAQYIQTLSPQLSAWRRDFHHFAESGWVEFRTAAKVAEILDSLGYELAMAATSSMPKAGWGCPMPLPWRRSLPARGAGRA